MHDVVSSDVQMKFHEALVVFVETSRWHWVESILNCQDQIGAFLSGRLLFISLGNKGDDLYTYRKEGEACNSSTRANSATHNPCLAGDSLLTVA